MDVRAEQNAPSREHGHAGIIKPSMSSSVMIYREKFLGALTKKFPICVSANVVLHSQRTSLVEEVLPVLLRLAQHAVLYLLVTVQDSKEQLGLMRLFEEAKLLDFGLKPHRVLFCTTTIGKIAMVRQLDPHLFIDSAVESLQPLEPFVPIAVVGNSFKALKSSTLFVNSFNDIFA